MYWSLTGLFTAIRGSQRQDSHVYYVYVFHTFEAVRLLAYQNNIEMELFWTNKTLNFNFQGALFVLSWLPQGAETSGRAAGEVLGQIPFFVVWHLGFHFWFPCLPFFHFGFPFFVSTFRFTFWFLFWITETPGHLHHFRLKSRAE